MRPSERIGDACLSLLALLALASCAAVQPATEPIAAPAPETAAAMPEPALAEADAGAAPSEAVAASPEIAAAMPEHATPAPDCAALFAPVTDQSQDKDEPECAAPGDPALAGYARGHSCKLRVGFVRPTQPAVGVTAVNCKRDGLVAREKLDKYLRKGRRVVPAVIGPDGNYYITDHHHLATALYKTLEEKPEERESTRLYAQIVGNFLDPAAPDPGESGMRRFWETMSGCNNAFLRYLGEPIDPLDPAQMPDSLAALRDDPFRTLSRWVRDAGGYVKPEVAPANFLEFTWGDKFRRDLAQRVTLCPLASGVASAECQAQIAQLRRALGAAMASARAYDSVEWIESGRCAGEMQGDPEALVACGYNPARTAAPVDKYITADRGCETAGAYAWEAVTGAAPPADALVWYEYARGHASRTHPVCRAGGDGPPYAGMVERGAGCSYVDTDGKRATDPSYDALTGVQRLYIWTAYTDSEAKKGDFFDDAVPVGGRDGEPGNTYLCAAGDRVGWVEKDGDTCHLSKKGLGRPFSVLRVD